MDGTIKSSEYDWCKCGHVTVNRKVFHSDVLFVKYLIWYDHFKYYDFTIEMNEHQRKSCIFYKA